MGVPADSRPDIVRACAITATVVAVVVGTVGIHGDFPLSDDWAYAHVVRALCVDGEVDLLPWTGASLIAQAAWGAVACWLFGFDFSVLRWTTVVLSAAGILATWWLARRAGAGRAAAALAAAAVGFNPVWLNLSFTFMTDVPFAALAAVATAAFVASDAGRRPLRLAAAVCLCAVAALVRQHGVFVGAAAAIWLLADAGKAPGLPPRRVVRAALSATVPTAALALWYGWLWTHDAMPQAATNKAVEIFAVGPLRWADAGLRAAATLGLFMLPLTLADAQLGRRLRRPESVGAALLLIAGATIAWMRDGSMMFYLPNVLHDFSLGATTLRDSLALGLGQPPTLGVAFTAPVTLVSLVGAAALVGHLRERLDATNQVDALCTLAAAALLAGSMLQARYYFDRYLLAALPLVAVVLARDLGTRIQPAGLVAGVVLAAGAVAGTHDYMEWNRLRWQMLEELETRGVSASSIDGGMEYNAWRLAAEAGDWPSDDDVRQGAAPDRPSWWWVDDDEWIIGFRPLAGYEVIASRHWRRWLGPGQGTLFLLRRRLASQGEHLGVHTEQGASLQDDLHRDAHPPWQQIPPQIDVATSHIDGFESGPSERL